MAGLNPFNATRIIDVVGPVSKYTGLVTIGTLSFINDKYVFTYNPTHAFALSRPLAGLSQQHNESDDPLRWTFFNKRWPVLDRPDVKAILMVQNIDITRPMAVLATLGARVATDPRMLVARI